MGARFRARGYTEDAPRAHSSAGRARRWQRRGRRFEPGWVHWKAARRAAFRVLVAGWPHDRAPVGALHDEREHAVGEVRLDGVDRTVDQPVALVAREPHVERALVAGVDHLGVQAVGGERLGEVAADPAARHVDLDRLGHAGSITARGRPYACFLRSRGTRAGRASGWRSWRARSSSSGTRWLVFTKGSRRTFPPASGTAATSSPSHRATIRRPKGSGCSASAARRSSAGSSDALHMRSSSSPSRAAEVLANRARGTW